MRNLTCDPKLEMLGLNLSAFIDNIQAEEIDPVLQKYGLTQIDPYKWYSAPVWLDALNDLQEQSNMTSNMVAIGMEIGRIVPMPPGKELSLAEVLAIWNDALYQPLFRNGDAGFIKLQKLSDTHYVTIHENIWPDDFSYGIAYGLARRFLPRGTGFKVYYDEQIPRMDEGGKATHLHIAW
ncbi:MAG: hypothetical protein GC204_01950 [Chloroflexi bacterium]|nr:hypothetical protein [Chloroflexota bacterium]